MSLSRSQNQRLKSAQQKADLLQSQKRILESQEGGEENVRIPVFIKINRCRLERSFVSNPCGGGHNLWVEIYDASGDPRSPRAQSGNSDGDPVFKTSHSRGAPKDWIEWGNTMQWDYQSTGTQSLLVKVFHQPSGMCGGGGPPVLCGTATLNLGVCLKELLAHGGKMPTKRYGLKGKNGSEIIGEFYISLQSSGSTLGQSIELLLQALLANAEKEPECLIAVKDILDDDGGNLNVVDYRDPQGNTLLHTACKYCQEEIIDILLDDFGMSLNVKNNRRQTPLVVACSQYERSDGKNYLLACKLAVKMHDVQSMFDAIEGCIAAGLDLKTHHPIIKQCLDTLVSTLQAQLSSDDEDKLAQAIEMAKGIDKDSPLARLITDEVATKKLVTIQLQKAMGQPEERVLL